MKVGDSCFWRLATASDLDLLLVLTEEFYREERIPFDAAVSRSAIAALLGHPSCGSVWLIVVDFTPAGYFALTLGFILEFGGLHAVLDEFYLRPAFRGQGHGRATLRHVEEICRGLGVRSLRLEVDLTNHRAESLYRAQGFTAHERRTMTKVL